MASDEDRLGPFIAAAKSRGVDDEFVVAMLRQNGWSEKRIYAAFSTYYEGVLGEAVPARGGRAEYAGEAFLYLLAFISLASWACALGNLFYSLIDRAFPDQVTTSFDYYGSFREAMTWQLATLLIAFPLYAYVTRSIVLMLRARPEAADSGVRKWLTYLALVITATTLLGDAIWFLQAFLHGDLTIRFVLKSLVVLAIAGGIFTYYLSGLRGDPTSLKLNRVFAGVAGAAVLAGLGFGFFYTGSPAYQRSLDADERRISDLKAIANDLHEVGEPLPVTLRNLYARRATPPDQQHSDPVTSIPYQYRPLTKATYRLCATFETDDSKRKQDIFKHAAGPACFTLDSTKTYD